MTEPIFLTDNASYDQYERTITILHTQEHHEVLQITIFESILVEMILDLKEQMEQIK